MRLRNSSSVTVFTTLLLLLLISILHSTSGVKAIDYLNGLSIVQVDGANDVSGQWNKTGFPLIANNTPMGPILPKFNVDADAVVKLSVSMSNARNMSVDGTVYHIETQQNLFKPIGNNQFQSADGGTYAVTGISGGVNVGETFSHAITPCDTAFLQTSAQDLQAAWSFQSNVTLIFDLAVRYQVIDEKIENTDSTLVPSAVADQYFTYVPSTDHKYDLTLSFASTKPGVSISERLINMRIDCGNFILFEGNNTYQVQTIRGLEGPTNIMLISSASGTNDIKISFEESHHKEDDDDDLLTWQIVLIAIGGGVLLAVVLMTAVGIALYLRKRSSYTRIGLNA